MGIVANTLVLDHTVTHYPDYIADTLAELQATPGPYLNKFVLVLESGKLYKVLEDLTVQYTSLKLANDVRTFIQGSAPTVDPGTKYLWIQTGLGVGGDGFSVWFDDGV